MGPRHPKKKDFVILAVITGHACRNPSQSFDQEPSTSKELGISAVSKSCDYGSIRTINSEREIDKTSSYSLQT
ncbi:MAG: hypothetical protein HXS46_12100 [Theionarchaea archaeon]|nr:hypothetical protein [Theionarchaea archaeon]